MSVTRTNNGMSTSVYVSNDRGAPSSGVGFSGVGFSGVGFSGVRFPEVRSSGVGSSGVGSSFLATTDPGIVLVTGASGFIATHVVQLLMRNGYRVRGTVRDITNEAKVRPLLNLCPQPRYPLELIEADLNDPDSWDRAVRGCRYVLHIAGHISTGVVDPDDEFAKSVVNSTLTVLRSCHRHRVKRVVYTSSVGAIYGDFGTKDPPDMVYTENCWTRTDTAEDAYIRAKTFSERAAWNFLAELPDHERFELAVINPAAVFGPILSGGPGTSSELLQRMLSRELPLIPKISIPVVDVRDVALGHLRAMTLPQAAGRRFILFSGINLWTKDVARIIYNEFEPQGYDIPTKNCPLIFLKILALFDKTTAAMLPTYGRVQHFDNSQMRSILGITPSAPDRTMIDMAYSMIERGFIKKTRKYRGPPIETNSPSCSCTCNK